MNLQQYQWSGNPRGLHNDGPFKPFFIERYVVPRLGWAKLLAGANEYVDAVAQLVAHGVTPIVRIYRESMGGMAPPESWWSYYQQYIEAGCRWFELYNEPNLDDSWGLDGENQVTWRDTQGVIAPLMDHWLAWAERIIELGAYPAFPAMAEIASDDDHATLHWLDACLHYLATRHAERFLAVAANGLWVATHPTLLNHFYQEPPGGPGHMARPYYQQDAREDGWHFEYPADPLQQRLDPGCTAIGGTESKPYGAPAGLIAAGEIFQHLLYRHFRVGPLPVVGTAGGIMVPKPGDPAVQPDTRYPAYNHENHAQAVLAMWYWIAGMAPPWFLGLTLSDEEAYYEMLRGPAPALRAMATSPVALRTMPDLDPIQRERTAPVEPPPPEVAQQVQVEDPLELRFEHVDEIASLPVVEGDVVSHPGAAGDTLPEAVDGELLPSAPQGNIAYAETDEDVDRLLAETAYLLEPGESTEGLPRLLPGNPHREGHVQLLARVTRAGQQAAESVTPSPLPPIELNPPTPPDAEPMQAQSAPPAVDAPGSEPEVDDDDDTIVKRSSRANPNLTKEKPGHQFAGQVQAQSVVPSVNDPDPQPEPGSSASHGTKANPNPNRIKENLDYLFEEMTGTGEADPWPWRTRGIAAQSMPEPSPDSIPESSSKPDGEVLSEFSEAPGANETDLPEESGDTAVDEVVSNPVSITGLWLVLGPDGPFGWMLDAGRDFIAAQRPVLLPEPSLLRYGSPTPDLVVLILATERHLPTLTARVEGMVNGALISGYAVSSAEDLGKALEEWQRT